MINKNGNIKELYKGSQKCGELYKGGQLMYSAHDPRGYWVRRTTGVKTYFDLTADWISGTVFNRMPTSIINNVIEVKVPDGVTELFNSMELDTAVFYSYPYLTKVILPNSLVNIGRLSFYYSRLLDITIPENVAWIGNSAFRFSTDLTSIIVLNPTPPTLVNVNVLNNTNDAPIKVPSGSVNAYKSATNWSTYASRISAI